ncbi:Probable RNA-directed DNA polymerase from transposon BS [Eumeta japonica]|uniref:Probable RNA-directed DNA polymerase from transposon BS n=1 Tax=Eumeta variegata TaxID=151549 RepID=A0A4C1Z9Y4_EUMVA|nr:Probable RNA-directed DNA polymerase from transposon BS [Eumeta japonica]
MLFYTVVKLTGRDFNACIKKCYFPPAWKEAEVIGIYKPGKPRDLPASYRPISLLSGLGKLFEKILKTRLSDHLLGKGLIIDEQFGFRPAHSCPQQVLRLVEYVSEGFETERSTVAVFFDVAKAFDRVWHAGLIYKLYSLQVPDRLIITIQNYLANRHFTFRHERTHSTRRLIRAGVPQGSTLSPLPPRTQTMYRDRRRLASNSRYSRTIPRSFTEIGIGAPDSPSSLQRAIDELGQWFRKWRIEVNPTNQQPYNSSMGLRTPTISKHMKDASKRFFDIAGSHPNALARRLTINRRIPTLSVGHETYLPTHLTLLQRQLK